MASETQLLHKGIHFPRMFDYSTEHLNYIEDEFQLMDDDVVNVTFPKSGTNWMAEILSLIRQDGDPTWARSVLLPERMPWIESFKAKDIILNYAPPRFLTSHLPLQLFPKSFFSSKAKIIYTVRNPKDVLVSAYYFAKIFIYGKKYGTLQEAFEDFLNGTRNYGSWFDHVKDWMTLKDKPNFFYITYEELQQDLRGSVERICHFLGKELTSQQIDSVVENASFETMKENKMSNMTEIPMMDFSKGTFMRKGKSGTWKSSLTVAQSEEFDRVYREKMRGMTVTFPWD